MAFLVKCSICGSLYPYRGICPNNCNKKKKSLYNKNYDKNKRNKDSTAFYHSAEWRIVKDTIMDKYGGICMYSFVIEHKVIKANVVHHIYPIKLYPELALNPEFLMPLSHKVHNKIESNYNEKTIKLMLKILEEWSNMGGG